VTLTIPSASAVRFIGPTGARPPPAGTAAGRLVTVFVPSLMLIRNVSLPGDDAPKNAVPWTELVLAMFTALTAFWVPAATRATDGAVGGTVSFRADTPVNVLTLPATSVTVTDTGTLPSAIAEQLRPVTLFEPPPAGGLNGGEVTEPTVTVTVSCAEDDA